MQRFLSLVNTPRTAHKALRFNTINVFKHKKRKVLSVTVLSHPKPATLLAANRIVTLCSRQDVLNRRLHTTVGLQKQDENVPPVYYIQNPFSWLRNKMQFGKLRGVLDPEFSEEEFLRGARQAIASITHALARDDFESLETLINAHSAAVLNVTSRLWKKEVKENIALRPEEIRLALPINVVLNYVDNPGDLGCDIDIWFVGVKSIAEDTWFVVEMLARFNRDYAKTEHPEWNVAVFQVRRFNVRSARG